MGKRGRDGREEEEEEEAVSSSDSLNLIVSQRRTIGGGREGDRSTLGNCFSLFLSLSLFLSFSLSLSLFHSAVCCVSMISTAAALTQWK
jgi:hypothetical protein